MGRASGKVFKKRVNWQKKVKNMLHTMENIVSMSSAVEVPRYANTTDPQNPSKCCAPCSATSASSRKLRDTENMYQMLEKGKEAFEIIDISKLSEVLEQNVCCKKCYRGKVSLHVERHIGLAAKFVLICSDCNNSCKFSSSDSVKINDIEVYNVNIRLVYGLRAIGKGRAAGAMLCGVMNLPPPPSKFEMYNYALGSAAEDVSQKSMREAVEEAVEENGNSRDLTVALDGTWQKRGHTSNNGVVTATSVDTGKVIDVAIMSKYCRCSNKLNNEHSDKCTANYSGNSGGMEVAGVQTIFDRSSQYYNVRYLHYLGDGDSKAFKHVVEREPYGNNVEIRKLECVGHVQKRMGARLRRLKTTMKGKMLSDGKKIDGKGRLTDAAIDNIQNCYGLAIRQNTNDVQSMRKAVWALFFHIASTNEHPSHGLCPDGQNSWCKYNRGKITGENYNHHHSLPAAVMEEIKPVFRDLSDVNLLKKCLHGRTQNPNESVNSVIWHRLPKTVFVGINTLHFGVYDAVASFNQGNITKCQVLELLGIPVGSQMVSAMLALDQARIRDADNSLKLLVKKARKINRGAVKSLQDELEDENEDFNYGPGMF